MTDLTREQIEEIKKWKSLFDRGEVVNFLSVGETHDLARQCLSLMDERDEAQAAQAGVVEQAAKLCDETADEALETSGECTHRALSLWFRGQAKSIRALADPTGVKLLAELRAERDNATRGRNEWRDDYKALAKAIVGETGLSAMTVAAQARLYRPRAEAAEAQLAEVQKREAGLRDAIALALRKMQPIQNLTAYNVLMTALSAAPTGEESNG